MKRQDELDAWKAPLRAWEPKPNRWDLEVDPELVLPVAERYRRAEAARQAFFVEQGLKARKRNRERRAAEMATPIPPMTHEERRLRGRLGGLRLAATHDSRKTTAAALAAGVGRFDHQVDPDGVLDPDERARRAKAARAAYYARLCLASLEARENAVGGGRSDPQAAAAKATKRRLHARLGAYSKLAGTDVETATEPMRKAALRRLRELLESIVPADVPDHEEALRDAESAYFRELAKRPRAPRDPETPKRQRRPISYGTTPDGEPVKSDAEGYWSAEAIMETAVSYASGRRRRVR